MAPVEANPLRQVARSFARDTLGCECPDEVFAEIEIDPRQRPEDGSHTHRRMLIGNRLLIFVLEEVSSGEESYLLDDFTHAGRSERDTMGYNRVRLVFVADEPKALERQLRPLFEAHPAVDERVHLHVLAPDSVRAINLAVP